MKMRLEIPEPLFKQVEACAALQGAELDDVVVCALTAYMTRPQPVSANPFPVVRGKAGPLMQKMNNKTIAELEQKDDLERHRRSLGHRAS
jgi:hypothetical protein